MKVIPGRRHIPAFGLLLAGWMLSFSLAADPIFASASQSNLSEVAQGIPTGGALRIFDLGLDQFGIVNLELERFTVFTSDAKILIDGDDTPASPPKNAYFRGRVTGLPNAIVVLTVLEQGEMRGLITDEAGVWLLAGNSGRGAAGLENRKVGRDGLASLSPYTCGTDALPIDVGESAGETPGAASIDTAALPGNVSHTARVAVETDYEYFQKFGNQAAALDYMGDLFAYASTVYEREVNTNLVIGWSRLWPNGAASDPWTATSGTSSVLYEFRDHWTTNMGGVDRTIAHMLSGKDLGGGIAYLGVLCNESYGYGVSTSLNGDFNIDSPGIVWDILVVSHEIGHNFSSDHTQDYCGVDGFSDPVDLCYDSARSCGNALGLPGVDSLSGGLTIDKPGTIMSYCHHLSGGMSNIGFTFGLDHMYGVAADRVPAAMYDHVLARAASYPGCLELIVDSPQLNVLKDGSGSGTVTSDPGGIDCSTDCTHDYTHGTVVTLTATPAQGSVFLGWGGACSGTGSCVVTMNANKSVTATFAEVAACTLDVNLQYEAGDMTLGLQVGTTQPAWWGVWLIIQGGGTIPVVGTGLPVIDPPTSLAPVFAFPQAGLVYAYTLLHTPADGVICDDLDSVDTGGGLPKQAEVTDETFRELREVLSDF